MPQELLRRMREIDAVAARINPGVSAVAIVLSLALVAGLTVRLGQEMSRQDAWPDGLVESSLLLP